MKNILYPVIFHTEDVGYSISVPDIDGCFSEGGTLEEAYENAFDALGLCLEEYLENNTDLPPSSNPATFKLAKNEFIAFIEFDSIKYAKKHDTRAVKKTLSIPSWLNSAAEAQHINFSDVLQSALKKHLHID